MLGMNWYQVVELYKLVTTKMLSKLKKPKQRKNKRNVSCIGSFSDLVLNYRRF